MFSYDSYFLLSLSVVEVAYKITVYCSPALSSSSKPLKLKLV
jgi:hypothetical protein